MRVVLCAPNFAPHRGGLEQYCRELARRIAAEGHRTLVLTSRFATEADSEAMGGFQIVRLDSWGALSGRWPVIKPTISNAKRLLRLLRIRPDIVITQTRFFIMSLLGTALAAAKRIPHLHVEHGTCHPQLESPLKRLFGNLYDHTLGAFVVRHATKVVGISKAAAAFARHLGAGRTSVVHNCVDTERFRKVHTDLRARLGLDDAFIITFVGRLIEAKGVQDLIYAVTELKKRYPRLALVIVGDGFYRSSLEKRVEDGDGVLFLGEKGQDDIVEILSISDMFVNPSWSEGLPTSVLEAGAMGLAIVATDVGGTREIIADGENGLLISPRSPNELSRAIEKLLADDALRSKLGLQAEKTVRERFAWDNVVGQLIAEMEECAGAAQTLRPEGG